MCLLKLIKSIFSQDENSNTKKSNCSPYIEANLNDYSDIVSYNAIIPDAFQGSYNNLTLEDAILIKDLCSKYPGCFSFSFDEDGSIYKLDKISLEIDRKCIGWISKCNVLYIDEIIETYRSLKDKTQYKLYAYSSTEKWEFRAYNKIECALLGVDLRLSIPHYYNEAIDEMQNTIKSSGDCNYKLVYLRSKPIKEARYCSERIHDGMYEYELLSYINFRSGSRIECTGFEEELKLLQNKLDRARERERVFKQFQSSISIGMPSDEWKCRVIPTSFYKKDELESSSYTEYDLDDKQTLLGFLRSKTNSACSYLVNDFLNDNSHIYFEFDPKCLYLKEGKEYVPFELSSTSLELLKEKQILRTVTKTVKLDI